MSDLSQYYRLFGIEPGASPEQIKHAYRSQVKKWHPDQYANDPQMQKRAEEELKRLNEAYEKIRSFPIGAQAAASQQQRQRPRPRPDPESFWGKYGPFQRPKEAYAPREPGWTVFWHSADWIVMYLPPLFWVTIAVLVFLWSNSLVGNAAPHSFAWWFGGALRISSGLAALIGIYPLLEIVSIILSKTTSVAFFTFVLLMCLNLALLEIKGGFIALFLAVLWGVYKISGIIGRYFVDILFNIAGLILVIALTFEVKWYRPIPNDTWIVYFLAASFIGLILAVRDLKRSPIRRILRSLNMSTGAEIEAFKIGTTDHRLVFAINTRDAATVIDHFFRDPRPWLSNTPIFYFSPFAAFMLNVENSYGFYSKVLWVKHKTTLGQFVDLEVIKFIRVGSNKFLIRAELDSREWYVFAHQNFGDLRRAIFRTDSAVL